jgi:splicing factor 3B subunit 3
LYLYVGLSNGILMRSLMDESAGSLSDTRKRFLGTKPVHLHRVQVRGANAVVALSSRNWLSYVHTGRFHMVPLSYHVMEYVSSFCSEQCPDGLVCVNNELHPSTGKVVSSFLRIVTIDRLGVLFNQTVLPLKYTPRRMAVHPISQLMAIVETDHNAYNESQKAELREAMREADAAAAAAANGEADEESMDVDGGQQHAARVKAEKNAAAAAAATDASLNEVFMGAPHAGEGAWASSVRLVHPKKLESVQLRIVRADKSAQLVPVIELANNEAAFSVAIVQLASNAASMAAAGATGAAAGGPDAWYLVFGTVQNYVLSPRSFSSGFLHVYKFVDYNEAQMVVTLQFMHRTPVPEIPLALAGFQRRLAVGVGRTLSLYNLGESRLLKHVSNRNFPHAIQSLQVAHDRLFVGDLCEGFSIVLYRRSSNELEIVADSTSPRYLTAQALLDFDTLAGADKFGNVFVSRLSADISRQFLSGSSTGAGANASDQTIATLMNKYAKSLQGAAHKLTDVANFYIGDTVTALSKAALVPGGSEVLVYATLSGGLGVLLPFTSREDAEFFTHLEMHLRQEPGSASLVGRDHLAYRSYYAPVKAVVDGDLCDLFGSHLTQSRQTAVAEELVCTPAEVAKRIEELRNRVL